MAPRAGVLTFAVRGPSRRYLQDGLELGGLRFGEGARCLADHALAETDCRFYRVPGCFYCSAFMSARLLFL